MALSVKRPNGIEDVMPQDIHKWRTVEEVTKSVAERFGFKEIRIPTFEDTELFQRSVGETTDVVQKEMYTVTAKERTFTLRPEGTAGTMRAMIQNGLLNEALPQKVFYTISCFRNERPQAGRLREFHQFGVEMAGSKSPAADAEVISLAYAIIKRLDLKNIKLFINSIGCPKCRSEYQNALKEFFNRRKSELCDTCLSRLERNPMRILDCKSPICSEIAKDAPIILDFLCDECKEHFENLQMYLTAMNISFEINPRIVRGLDYYTKTVFEFVTTDIGAQGTVCGGGRYDGLIEELGGEATPSLGFGMGLERLILTMEKQNCDFFMISRCDLYIVSMDADSLVMAVTLSKKLREEGYWVEYDLMGRGIKSQMKYANKLNTKFVMVLGSNEMETGIANLKNMGSGEQVAVNFKDYEKFKNNLSESVISELFRDNEFDVDDFI